MTISRQDLLTIPGGVKVFFRVTGETPFRDFGNISAPSIESVLNTLPHFSSRGGTRAKDKESIIEKSMAMSFSFDEPNIKNLQLAFLGGTVSDVVAGSTAITAEGITLYGTDATGLALQMHNTHGVVVKNWAGSTTYLINATKTVVSVTKSTKTIVVATDLTTTFTAGRTFTITGATVAGNNATYTVDSSSYSAPNTSIVVNETPADDGVDGTINVGDYSVSVPANTITRTAYSSIADGDDVQVDYNWDAPALKKFAMFKEGIITGAARFLLTPTSGRQIYWEIPSVEIRPAGSPSLDDQNWMTMPMTLNILDNSAGTPNSPFGDAQTYVK